MSSRELSLDAYSSSDLQGRWVTRYSVRGNPYLTWEPPEIVPWVPNEFLDYVIYLYRSRHEAEEGINIGGSGFLVSVPATTLPPPANFIYAVTNAHVIEKKACTIRINTKDEGTDILELKQNDWFCSQTDDLAVYPIQWSEDFAAMGGIPTEDFVTPDTLKEYNFGIGDEVATIGRFINHEGKQRNMPSGRFGHIAQMPHEPIEYEIGNRIHRQESFVADLRSIGGYSGSPVFLVPDPDLKRGGGRRVPRMIRTTWVLGVDWGHILDWQPVYDQHREPTDSGLQVQWNTGMMGIVPAWKLRELLERNDLKKARDQAEERERAKRAAPKAAADVRNPPANDENPKH